MRDSHDITRSVPLSLTSSIIVIRTVVYQSRRLSFDYYSSSPLIFPCSRVNRHVVEGQTSPKRGAHNLQCNFCGAPSATCHHQHLSKHQHFKSHVTPAQTSRFLTKLHPLRKHGHQEPSTRAVASRERQAESGLQSSGGSLPF